MGFFDSALSIATGGVSDLVQGDAPFSSLGDGVAKWVAPFVNPGAVSAYGVKTGIQNKDYGQSLQYLVDPITEPGIDTIARGSGPVIGKISPELRKNAATIGATIGTIAAYGAPWGTLAGYEIGNKIAGGSGTQGVIGGAAIGAASAAAPYIGKIGAGLLKTGINVGGNYLNQILMANPSQIKQEWESLKPYEQQAFLRGQYTPQGLLNTQTAPDYVSSDSPTPTPSFEKTELPKLTDYDESKEKKIAEALTDEYKNYKLNDYMLYKQDPDKLQELILRYT